MKNPFSNTKAVHLNNNEIVEYWVDIDSYKEPYDILKNLLWSQTYKKSKIILYQSHFNVFINMQNNINFLKVVEPTNSKPFIILGGKGSGKTHILRYFSYYSRKELAKLDNLTILQQLEKDGFFSVLLELGNFAFERFQNSNLEFNIWKEWFYYYLNIILIEAFLEQVIDLQLEGVNDFDFEKIKKIKEDYFFDEDIDCDTIEKIYFQIKKEHKKIDKAFSRMRMGVINNIDSIEPLFDTREHRFRDITYSIIKASPSLCQLRVLFFLDQFEDLSDEQQKFINTIIRHPNQKYNDTISLRIMGRLYAIKTEETFSDNEKILRAEVTKKYLESYMKNKKSYRDFILRLIQKRLNKKISARDIVNSFTENEDKVLDTIKTKYPKSMDRLYFIKLKKELKEYQKSLLLSDKNIEIILKNLEYEDDPIKEKENIWLIYQAWSKNISLLSRSNEIKNSLNSKGKDIHKNETLKHLKDTFYFQLLKEHSLPIHYCGFDLILQLSSENPRNFMDIISAMYDDIEYYEEKIFDAEKPISCKLQSRAIELVSDKFWDDAVIDLKDQNVIRMVKRLNSFFKLIRISDKPTEKTLISFSYKGKIKEESQNILKKAVEHLFLRYEKNSKKEKNKSGEMLDIYFTTPILTIKWDLPTIRGGVFQFSANDIDVLCLEDDKSWEKLRNKYMKRYNVPFQRVKKNETPSLFGEL